MILFRLDSASFQSGIQVVMCCIVHMRILIFKICSQFRPFSYQLTSCFPQPCTSFLVCDVHFLCHPQHCFSLTLSARSFSPQSVSLLNNQDEFVHLWHCTASIFPGFIKSILYALYVWLFFYKQQTSYLPSLLTKSATFSCLTEL